MKINNISSTWINFSFMFCENKNITGNARNIKGRINVNFEFFVYQLPRCIAHMDCNFYVIYVSNLLLGECVSYRFVCISL